jgi:molecular chaperone GrpE
LTDSATPADKATATVKPATDKTVVPTNGETNWQEKAWRLQADMDNFRKRQMRRADDVIIAERERLLNTFLPVVDNLARALAHQDQADDTLRRGVELTHRQLMHLLEAEGVTRLETVGQPFDPDWHEAIAVIQSDAGSDIIVEEVEAGYKLEAKLLRPAKVVVAA